MARRAAQPRYEDEPVEVMVVTRTEQTPRLSITTNGQALKQTAAFKYLGSWVYEQGGLDHEIRARCRKW